MARRNPRRRPNQQRPHTGDFPTRRLATLAPHIRQDPAHRPAANLRMGKHVVELHQPTGNSDPNRIPNTPRKTEATPRQHSRRMEEFRGWNLGIPNGRLVHATENSRTPKIPRPKRILASRNGLTTIQQPTEAKAIIQPPRKPESKPGNRQHRQRHRNSQHRKRNHNRNPGMGRDKNHLHRKPPRTAQHHAANQGPIKQTPNHPRRPRNFRRNRPTAGIRPLRHCEGGCYRESPRPPGGPGRGLRPPGRTGANNKSKSNQGRDGKMKTKIIILTLTLALTAQTAQATPVTPTPDTTYVSQLTSHALNAQSVEDGFMVAFASWGFFVSAGWTWKLLVNAFS